MLLHSRDAFNGSVPADAFISSQVAAGSDLALKEGDAVDNISDAIPSCSSDLAVDSIQPIVESQLSDAAVADLPQDVEAAVVDEASAEFAAVKEEAVGVSFESAEVAEVRDQVEASAVPEVSETQEAGVASTSDASPLKAAEGSQVEVLPEVAVEAVQESGV